MKPILITLTLLCALAVQAQTPGPDPTTKAQFEKDYALSNGWHELVVLQATNQTIATNDWPFTSSSLRLDEITNWTGYQFQGRELGFIATNHVAVIQYQGATNEFVLKCVPSEKAVWRNSPDQNFRIWLTNYFDNSLTNIGGHGFDSDLK